MREADGEVALLARAAQADELGVVVALLEEAAQWLAARGISEQWPIGSAAERPLVAQIARGEVYLAWLQAGEGAGPVATMTLQWSDAAVWGDLPDADDAGYAHAFAVRRAYAGRGIGRALLAWAGDEVARRGRHVLRLDCMARNEALCAYYEGAGFRGCGEIGGARRYERAVIARA